MGDVFDIGAFRGDFACHVRGDANDKTEKEIKIAAEFSHSAVFHSFLVKLAIQITVKIYFLEIWKRHSLGDRSNRC